ncbi:hypothetical protein CJF31_00005009 [Rutstroemia sp. NJR-2017a BVV2]|nr:hypothetical protein CJF31_00005009 [Rutstroemia sp. NJR-2017a BVV2]
MVFRSLAMEV